MVQWIHHVQLAQILRRWDQAIFLYKPITLSLVQKSRWGYTTRIAVTQKVRGYGAELYWNNGKHTSTKSTHLKSETVKHTHTFNVFRNFHPVRPTLVTFYHRGLANSAPCCTRFVSSSSSYTRTCMIWSVVKRAAKGHTLQLSAEHCLYVIACHDVDIREYAPTPVLAISTTENGEAC